MKQTNTLCNLMAETGTDKGRAGHGYCALYDRLFAVHSDLRGTAETFVEIGVWEGASIAAWLDYFYQAHIIGIDTDLSRVGKRFEGLERVELIEMSASSESLISRLPDAIDILIDDGSHLVADHMQTFHNLWPKIRSGGFYIVEDLHTYFWPKSNPPDSDQWLIELVRDTLGRGKSPDKELSGSSIASLTFFQSLAVFRKL